MELLHFSKGELKIYFDLSSQDNEHENLLYILMNVPSCVYKIKKKLKANPMCGLQCILFVTFYIQNITSIYYPWSSAAKTLSWLENFWLEHRRNRAICWLLLRTAWGSC